MTALSDEQRQAAQRAGLPAAQARASSITLDEKEWGASHAAGMSFEEAQRAKAGWLAEQHGISPAQVEFCFANRLDVAEYARMRTVRSIEDFERVRVAVELEREAELEARRLAAVEVAKRKARPDA